MKFDKKFLNVWLVLYCLSLVTSQIISNDIIKDSIKNKSTATLTNNSIINDVFVIFSDGSTVNLSSNQSAPIPSGVTSADIQYTDIYNNYIEYNVSIFSNKSSNIFSPYTISNTTGIQSTLYYILYDGNNNQLDDFLSVGEGQTFLLPVSAATISVFDPGQNPTDIDRNNINGENDYINYHYDGNYFSLDSQPITGLFINNSNMPIWFLQFYDNNNNPIDNSNDVGPWVSGNIPDNATYCNGLLVTSSGPLRGFQIIINSSYDIINFYTEYTITNNSNETINDIQFFDSNYNLIIDAGQLDPWQNTLIIYSAAFVSLTLSNGKTVQMSLPAMQDTNIYSNYVLTNLTPYNLYFACTDSNGNSSVSGYPLSAQQSVQIINNTQNFTIYDPTNTTTLIGQTTITNNSSYCIFYINNNWSLNSYTPSFYNVYKQPLTNVQCYDSNNNPIGLPVTIDQNLSINIPGNANYLEYTIQFNAVSTTMTMPVTFPQTLLPYYNGTITNNSGQTITINFYGTINNTPLTSLNSTEISLANGELLYTPYGATAISVIDQFGGLTPINQVPIALDTQYSISLDTGSWTITNSQSNYLFNNNSSNNFSNISFYDQANNLLETISNVQANTSIVTPPGAVYASGQYSIKNGSINMLFPVSNNSTSNVSDLGTIFNTSGQSISVIFYNSSIGSNYGNIAINLPAISIDDYCSLVPDTNYVTVYDQLGSLIINHVPIDSSINYYVNYNQNSNRWSLDPAPLEISLTNNSTINNLSVLFSNRSIRAGVPDVLSSNQSIAIPSGFNAVQINYTDANNNTVEYITTISNSSSSNIFSQYTMSNTTGQDMYIALYDIESYQLNNNLIFIASGQTIPLPINATNISVFDQNQNPTNLVQAYLSNNNLYVDYDGVSTWSLDNFPTQGIFINNSNITIPSVQFYDNGNNPIKLDSTLNPWFSINIPSNAASVECSGLPYQFQPITIAINSPTDIVNLYTTGTITNNSNSNIFIIGLANDNSTVSESFTIPSGQTNLITTGTNSIIVYDFATPFGGPSVLIPQTTINSSQSYIINENNNNWGLYGYTPIIENNYSQSSGVAFYSNNPYLAINTNTFIPFQPNQYQTINGNDAFVIFNTNLNNIPYTLTIPISNNQISYLFTEYSLTNSSSQAVYVNIYSSYISSNNNIVMNNLPILLYPGQSIPLMTGYTSIGVFDLNGTSVLVNPLTPIITNRSLYINNIGNTFLLQTTNQSAVLQNNSNIALTTISFYDVNNQQTARVNNTGFEQSVIIAPNSNTAEIVYIDSNQYQNDFLVPVTDLQSSSIFSQNTILNCSSEKIILDFYGPINNIVQHLTLSKVQLLPGQSFTIMTGATQVTVYDSSQTELINNNLFNVGSNYIYYDGLTWSLVSSPTTGLITNNYWNTITDISFFDVNNTLISDAGSMNPWTTYTIPTGTTSIQIIGLVNTLDNFTITLNSDMDVINLYAGTIVTNDTDSQLNIYFYDSNGNPTGNCFINPNQSTPFVTNTGQIQVVIGDPVISQQPIDTTFSYIITTDGTSWYLDTYSPLLQNNNTQPLLQCACYDSNPYGQHLRTTGVLPVTNVFNISKNSSFVSCNTTINNNNYTLFYPTNSFLNITPIFSSQILQNSTNKTIYINLYGVIGNKNAALLNNTPIEIVAGSSAPLINGTTSVSVYSDPSGNNLLLTQNINTIDNYYFYTNAENWTLSTSMLNQLENNSNQSISGTIYFSDLTPPQNFVLNSWENINLPFNTSYVNLEGLAYSLGTTAIIIPNLANSITPVYTDYIFNNSSNQNIVILCYDINNTQVGNFTLSLEQSMPILNGTNYIIIKDPETNNTLLAPTLIPTNQSCLIAETKNVWSLTPYTPMVENSFIYNEALQVTFYNSNNQQIQQPLPIQAGQTIAVPANASYTTFDINVYDQLFDSSGSINSITIPSSIAQTSTLFDIGTILNTSGQFSITANFYATINGIGNTLLNSSPIEINAAIPIMSGATSISVYDQLGNPTQINLAPITSNNNYFIKLDGGVWSLAQGATLTNNSSSITITALQFFDQNGLPRSTILGPLVADGYYTIPANSTYANISYIDTITSNQINFNIPVSDTVSSTIFNGYTITNTAADNAYLIFYGDITNQSSNPQILNTTGSGLGSIKIQLNPGQIFNIMTGATQISLYDSNNIEQITQQSISLGYYKIEENNGTWTITQIFSTLTNNSQYTFPEFLFFDSNGTQIGAVTNITPYQSVTIPTTSLYAIVGFSGPAYLAVPVSDAVSSTFFSGYIVQNNADSDISITYHSNIGIFENATVNYPPFIISPGNSIFILTGAIGIEVFDPTGQTTYIPETPLAADTNYSINFSEGGGWTITPIGTLTNNLNQTIGSIQFYDQSNNPIGSATNGVITGQQLAIPATATNAQVQYNYSNTNISGTIIYTTPLSDSSTSVTATQYYITNTSTELVYVDFYGTINNGLPNPQQLNTTSIYLSPGAFYPILTGADFVTVETTPISQQAINSTSDYFINYDGINFSLDQTSNTGLLLNNSNQNIGNISFYAPGGILISSSSLYEWCNASIPSDTIVVQLNGLPYLNKGSVAVMNISNPSDLINIYTDYLITNSSNTDIAITNYDQNNNVLGLYTLPAGDTMQVFTTTNYVTIDTVDIDQIIINTSYIVTGTSGNLQVNSYSPTLTNNYSQPLNNFVFYNSNINSTPSTSPVEIIQNGTITIPGDANSVSFNTNITDNNTVINSSVSFAPTSDICGTGSLTNNASENVTVNFYNTENTRMQVRAKNVFPINSPAISIPETISIPIFSDIASISLYDLSGIEQITQQAINPNINYEITFIDGVWAITPIQTITTTLLNNSPIITISSITFYNSSSTQVGSSLTNIAPRQTVLIPATATTASIVYTDSNNNILTITIPVFDQQSSQIFTGYTIYNNTSSDAYLFWFGTINGTPTTSLSSPINIPAGTYQNILAGMNLVQVLVDGSFVISTSSINSNTNYYIDYNGDYSLDTIPTNGTFLTNNSNVVINTITFYNASGTNQSTASTILPNQAIIIPSTSTTASIQYIDTNSNLIDITIPISDSRSSNMFDGYTIFNNSSSDIGLLWFGTLNDNPDQLLNNNETIIDMPAGTYQLIPTGATSATFYGTPLASQPITTGTNYYIDYNSKTGDYSLDTIPTSGAFLINNSAFLITSLIFYDASNNNLGNPFNILPNQQIFIPIFSTSATFVYFDIHGNQISLNIPVSSNQSSTMFSNGYRIINNTSNNCFIKLYGTINGNTQEINSKEIIIPNGGYTLTPNGTTQISVYDQTNTQQIANQPINQNFTYYVNYNGDNWSIDLTPLNSYVLTNNSNLSINQITFYNNGILSGPIVTNINPNQPVFIPVGSTTATIQYIDTNQNFINITIPIIYNQSSNIFTDYTIYNNSGYDVTLDWYGTLNGTADTLLNNNGNIDIPAGTYQLIPTGVTSTLLHETSLPEQTIAQRTNYYINYNGDNFSFDINPLTGVFLTNNSNYILNSLSFYDQNSTLQGIALNIIPNQAVVVPANTSNVLLQYIDINGNNIGINIPVSDSQSSNIFTGYSIYNNSGQTTSLIWYDSNDNQLNTNAIYIPTATYQSMFTGVNTFAIYDSQGLKVIGNATLNPNVNYYIDYNGNWSLDTSPTSGFFLTNNSNITLDSITFYNGTSTINSSAAYITPNQAIAIPETAVSAFIQYTDNSGNQVNLTVEVSPNQSSAIFSGYNIFNNSGLNNVTISWLSSNNYQMNQAPITIPAGSCSPIPITAIKVVVLYNNNFELTAPISPNINYYIDFDGDNWLVDITPISNSFLINNSNITMSSITFYDTNNTLLAFTNNVSQNAQTIIPTDSTHASIQYTDSNGNQIIVTISVSSDQSSNIFSGYTIFNNTTSDSVVEISWNINGNITNRIKIPNGSYQLIMNGTIGVNLYNDSDLIIANQIINQNTNYYIDRYGRYSIDTTPTSGAFLINNNNLTLNSITFYGGIQTVAANISPNQGVPIPAGSTSATIQYFDTNGIQIAVTIPVSANQSSNIFTGYSIYNIDGQLSSMIWYDINGNQMNQQNIYIPAQNHQLIFTGTLQVSIFDNTNTEQINQQTINPNINYYINYNGSSWSLDTTPLNLFVLTNNSHTTLYSLAFYHQNAGIATQTGGIVTNITPNQSIIIPPLSTSATIQYFDANGNLIIITIPISDQASSNIFTGYSVYNNSGYDAAIIWYGIINGTLQAFNNTAIDIPTGTYQLIPTGTISVSIAGTSITQQAITNGINYYIDYISQISTWLLTPNSLSGTFLTNNSNVVINKITFMNGLSSTGNGLNLLPNQSISVPLGSNYVTLQYIDTNGNQLVSTIPISDSQSSNIFTGYSIYNNSGQNTSVVYFDINGNQINPTNITIPAGTYQLMLTGTLQISVYDATQTEQIHNQIINPSLNYYIDFNSQITAWSLDPLPGNTPVLINNSSITISSINFYNSPLTTIGLPSSNISPNSTIIIPSGAIAAQIVYTDTNNNQLTFIIPVSSNRSSNIFSGYTITNVTNQDCYLQWFATIGGIPVFPMSFVPISIPAGTSQLLLSGTTLVEIFYQGQNVLTQTINPNNNYYIYGSNPSFSLQTFPLYIYGLINNSNTILSNISFYDINNLPVNYTITNILPNQLVIIPNGMPVANAQIVYTDSNSNKIALYIPVKTSQLSNIFSGYTIFNNTSDNLYLSWFSKINNNQINNQLISIPAGTYSPIINNTNIVTLYDQSQNILINQQFFNQNINYYINYSGSNYSIDTNPLTGSFLNNNSNSSINSLLFQNQNNVKIGVPVSNITPSQSIGIVSSSSSLTIQYNDQNGNLLNIIIPILASLQNRLTRASGQVSQNMFTGYTLLNNSGQDINIIWYGTVSGTANQPLNSTPINVPNGTYQTIMTGATSVAIYLGNTLENTGTLSQNANYYVNADYSVTTIPASGYFLNNNSGFTLSNVTFYTNSDLTTQITTFSQVPPNQLLPIPSTSLVATIQYTDNNGNQVVTGVGVSDSQSSNMFSGYSIINNSGQTIYINTLLTNFGLATEYPIELATGQSSLMMNGTIEINVYQNSDGTELLVSQEINQNSNYYIDYNGTTWTIDLTPSTGAFLTNNSSFTITTINFLDTNSNSTGTASTLSPNTPVAIPTNSVSASINYTDSNGNTLEIGIPVSDSASSNIFTGYTIFNNTDNQTIGISWTISINGTGLATQIISIPPYTYQQIMTGTTSVTATISIDGSPTTINQSISFGNNYFINFTVQYSINTAPAGPFLANNNSFFTMTTISFYNSQNVLQGNPAFNVSPNQLSFIPATSTYATVQYTDNNNNAMSFKIPVIASASSNIFTGYSIINNSGQNVYIDEYDSNGNLLTKNKSLILANSSTLISYGTRFISVYQQTNGGVGTQVITQQSIVTNSNYYIDYNNSTWSLDTTPTSGVFLTNNSSITPIQIIVFYNVSNSITASYSNISTHTPVAIPTGSIYARLQYVENNNQTNVTIPVSDSVSSNIFTGYTLLNNTSDNLSIIWFGNINGIPKVALNSQNIPIAPGALIQNLTGTSDIHVYKENTFVFSDSYNVNQNNAINKNGNIFSINAVQSISINNFNQQVFNLIFYNSSNVALNNPGITIAPGASVSTPTSASYAVFNTVFNSNFNDSIISIGIPVSLSQNTYLFNQANIQPYNITNSSSQTVNISFTGTINNNSVITNLPAISVLSQGQSIPIPAGTTNVSVGTGDTTVITNNQGAITASNSYFITNTNDDWSLKSTINGSSAVLQNNTNQLVENLVFYDNSNSRLNTSISINAYDFAPIPTNSVYAGFETFDGTTCYIPVDSESSSSIYTQSTTITNNYSDTVSINFYDALNGVRLVNTTPISLAAGQSMPLFTSTLYLEVLYDDKIVATSSNLLDLTLSYEIISDIIWQINPAISTLNNNSDFNFTTITFYDSDNNPISDSQTSLPTWSSTAIPSEATYVQANLGVSSSLILPLPTSSNYNVFAPNQLENSSSTDYLISSYALVNNVETLLTSDSFLLPAGFSTPLLTSTSSITVETTNRTPLVTFKPINSTNSYEIVNESNPLPAITSQMIIMRLLGGSASNTNTAIEPVLAYGINPDLFREFLYIDFYAQCITNSAARLATLLLVKGIIDTYQETYESQQNFNYLLNLGIIESDLLAGQTTLQNMYPDFSSQIEQFFTSLLERFSKFTS